ncbi:hypothetical protein ANO11243_084260 [Dothideomycetidae sp. 11243]|nr:hypothetical protein ANO11243_084260 [fungal sp. No.11243]
MASDAPEKLLGLKHELQMTWVLYLEALNRYSKGQARIGQSFSKGMFSLARANFKNSTGFRYGTNHFDQRMQATTRAKITGGEKDTSAFAATVECSSALVKGSSTSESTSSGILDDESENMENGNEPDQSAGSPPPQAIDPLKWFGILVPSELRQCQQDLVALTMSALLDAVNGSLEMRLHETKIRRLRKEIRKAEKSSERPDR